MQPVISNLLDRTCDFRKLSLLTCECVRNTSYCLHSKDKSTINSSRNLQTSHQPVLLVSLQPELLLKIQSSEIKIHEVCNQLKECRTIPNQARKQGGEAFGAFASPKFSKHSTEILTFAETFKE